MRTSVACLSAVLLLSCDEPAPEAVQDRELFFEVAPHDEEHEGAPDDPLYWSSEPVDPLYAIDCAEKQDTGYVKGDPYPITVVTVDGKPVEVDTANAFYNMQQQAAKDGVNIKVVSGFRTMAEQQYLYNCYINCNCNNCNLAAKPGFSNHQSGHALDLNTGAAGVYNWLAAHGGKYGFTETVPSEDWHWEWWGGGPAVSGPCGVPEFKATYVAQSFPPASMPPVVLKVGETLDAWIDLKNEGKATWTANTKLAPTPRDVASPLHGVDWLSPTRITAPDADTAPGAVGHFGFQFYANAVGDYSQTFGLVEEGVTWFSDAPKGGGPPDTQLEVHIVVIEPDPPPAPESTSSAEGGESGDEAGSTAGEVGGEVGEVGGEVTGGGGSAGEGGEGVEPTGSGGQVSGDMSEGTSSGGTGGTGGGALPPDYGSDEGCGCRGGGRGAGGGLALSGLMLGLLLRGRRRSGRARA